MNEPLFKNSFIRDKNTAFEIVKGMLLLTFIMKVVYVVFAISLMSTLLIAIIQNRIASLFSVSNMTTYVLLPILLLANLYRLHVSVLYLIFVKVC